MRSGALFWGIAIAAGVALGVSLLLARGQGSTRVAEVGIRVLPVRGGPEERSAEISSLAWYEDQLVLLPQFPARVTPDETPAMFTIERRAIERFLDGLDRGPLRARRVPLHLNGLHQLIRYYDGFEAIAFDGRSVFFSIETRAEFGSDIHGYVVEGEVVGDLAMVQLDLTTRQPLVGQTDLVNMGYEALVVDSERVLALYEVNGEVNSAPHALSFDRGRERWERLRMADLEYRVTDATEADAEGRFWVTNYHWPGSPWQPGVCTLTARHGTGDTHSHCRTVERLVELQWRAGEVRPTERAPILLELIDDDHARNWEGLVRLGSRGFLVVTDEHPESILAFVPGSP